MVDLDDFLDSRWLIDRGNCFRIFCRWLAACLCIVGYCSFFCKNGTCRHVYRVESCSDLDLGSHVFEHFHYFLSCHVRFLAVNVTENP